MTETANPVALARSRMLPSPLLREYVLTRGQLRGASGGLHRPRGCRGRGGDGACGHASPRRRRDACRGLRGVPLPRCR
jgi:hypothetical protein